MARLYVETSTAQARSKRSLWISERSVKIAWPPPSLQRMPDRFKRCVTSVLHDASTTPEPMGRFSHALLEREGLRDGEDNEDIEDDDDDEASRLTRSCQAASARGVTTVGPRAGRRLRLLMGEAGERANQPPDSCRAEGFDLHVGTRIRGSDRDRMERLARYALRPPLATERLSELPDGRLKYEFLHPWRDGTRAILFEPLELIERLVALIPEPRANLVRYHGTLAPGSKLRSRIVPAKPKAPARQAHAGCESGEAGERASASRRLSWAELIKRVFLKDALECPRCSGRMKLVATITQPAVIRKMLECIGLPARPPPLAPARPSHQRELDFEPG